MAAELDISIFASLSGLGDLMEFLPKKFSGVSIPTKKLFSRQIQAVADTEEALELGNITTTTQMLIIKCISNDVDLDLDFVAAFDADLTIQEGETAVIPAPSGVVYIKNNDAAEVSTVEYLLTGT